MDGDTVFACVAIVCATIFLVIGMILIMADKGELHGTETKRARYTGR